PARAELLDNRRVEIGRRREVEDAVAASAALVVDPVETLVQRAVAFGIVDLGLVVEDSLRKALPNLRLDGSAAGELVGVVEGHFAELRVVIGSATDADDAESARQVMGAREVIKRRNELSPREIAGCTKNHHGAWLGGLFEAQPLAERVNCEH